MLAIVTRLRELDVDLQPQGRLLTMDLTRAPPERDVEVIDPDHTLSGERSKQPREGLECGSLTAPVRPST